jgi:hypothetical protein
MPSGMFMEFVILHDLVWTMGWWALRTDKGWYKYISSIEYLSEIETFAYQIETFPAEMKHLVC